jgi:hypothetical protein
MKSRHPRGHRRSRPRTNTTPTVPVVHIEPVPVERTGIYDPVVDAVPVVAVTLDASAITPLIFDSIAISPLSIPMIVDPIIDRPSHWVRVTCPACGVVRVRAERVVMRNCVDDDTWSYRARCSECEIAFVGFTPATLALPAVAAGLALETWTLPVPSPRYSGSPLHAVDALELHLAMLEDDWFDQLARVEPLGDR